MTPVRFLLDTSALARLLQNAAVRSHWQSQITAGVMGVCPVTELEFLYSARSKADREKKVELLGAAFGWVAMPDRVYSRAADVQAVLTTHGSHRSAGAVDLLVAATAELSGLVLVHYDHDFDKVVKATGQPAVWLAEPGSID
jgi:predicted nucleic acid-binding protein